MMIYRLYATNIATTDRIYLDEYNTIAEAEYASKHCITFKENENPMDWEINIVEMDDTDWLNS